MYQALYRKYRPRQFSDVAGQQHITETLRNQIVTDRLSHAYLFVGTRGTGKTTCAKILSRAVNCLNPIDGNPCNKCLPCVGIEDGTILDVLELDAASNNGVDDVRALRDEAIYSPASVKKRVYIIDEVHMLSSAAFNALLKILEEPPEHILFILATTELHKVLPTIQSRCQRFAFRRLSLEEITARLCEIAASEGLSLMPEAAAKLAMLADGSMRDGISLLDQCATGKTIDLKQVRDTLGLTANDELLRIIRAIAERQTVSILDIVGNLYKDGMDMAALLSELSGIVRDLLIVRLDPDSSLINSGLLPSELSAMSRLFTTERLFYCLEIANSTLLGLSRTGISKLVLEMCLIRMSDERLSDDLPALAARIAELEAIGSGEASPAPDDPQPPPAEPLPTPDENHVIAIEPATLRGGPACPPAQKTPTPDDPQPPPAEPPPTPDENHVIAIEPATRRGGPACPPAQPPPPPVDILASILDNIDDPSVKVWFGGDNMARATQTGNAVVIYMTNVFSIEILKNSIDVLREAAQKVFGKEITIRIEAEKEGAN